MENPPYAGGFSCPDGLEKHAPRIGKRQETDIVGGFRFFTGYAPVFSIVAVLRFRSSVFLACSVRFGADDIFHISSTASSRSEDLESCRAGFHSRGWTFRAIFLSPSELSKKPAHEVGEERSGFLDDVRSIRGFHCRDKLFCQKRRFPVSGIGKHHGSHSSE